MEGQGKGTVGNEKRPLTRQGALANSGGDEVPSTYHLAPYGTPREPPYARREATCASATLTPTETNDNRHYHYFLLERISLTHAELPARQGAVPGPYARVIPGALGSLLDWGGLTCAESCLRVRRRPGQRGIPPRVSSHMILAPEQLMNISEIPSSFAVYGSPPAIHEYFSDSFTK